ncbi:MAG: hypothetical protein UT41_C0002G0191 [Candidatus Wolfebacteria bacterium GW2011_GWC2_39_22]|uniref:Uncharacterized protein n=2 Tax=Candidatus Wolfeibacteriota TaxID=1752735 RepID=A0A0G1H955_9BACT|nr:MAG: hypothetical protein UT41_C0002G0191 [Candidatus Wolfebacteria bacterium GW2011_GWC2_39_22]KKT43325.1 MAG: hypothetical protein UW32_C0002G0186 [Candidatus Wolfebacteria bacterium GW2011_GWE2_44_13]
MGGGGPLIRIGDHDMGLVLSALAPLSPSGPCGRSFFYLPYFLFSIATLYHVDPVVEIRFVRS